LDIYWQPVLQISVQTWNVRALESSMLGGSEMIAAEVEQVIDLIVGEETLRAPSIQDPEIRDLDSNLQCGLAIDSQSVAGT
jgi:hypothetical protein